MANAGKLYRRHRIDRNAGAIREALEAVGATVFPIGRPVDLLVGYRGRNWLLECKFQKAQPTDFQTAFFQSWRGAAHIVTSPHEAIWLVTGKL